MKDANLLLRAAAAGALNASADGNWVDFSGPDMVDMTFEVIVPQATGTTPTLDLHIQGSENGSTVSEPGVALPQITAAGTYYVHHKFNSRYRRFSAVTGGTTPNFGTVLIHPVPAGRYEKI